MHTKSNADDGNTGLLSGSQKSKTKYVNVQIAMVWLFALTFAGLLITTVWLLVDHNFDDTYNDDTTSNNDNGYGLPVSPFPDCNVGPMHHTHLIIPLAATEQECAQDTSRFMLSHGATFFCPHTWDIKLLVNIEEDGPRQATCTSYFNAIKNGQSPIHAFRPTLGQGMLPAEALGQLTEWISPFIYWVHDFGYNTNPDAGIDNGWNTTTIWDGPVKVNINQVLYSRQFDLQPSPPNLTYLVHKPSYGNNIILSHYISTSGQSGFDHIVTCNMIRDDGQPLVLRSTWPLYLTVPGVIDSNTTRFQIGTNYSALLNIYNTNNLKPMTLAVTLSVKMDYYYGYADGFSDFEDICPTNLMAAASPTMCIPGY
jgi:hypothetical protein